MSIEEQISELIDKYERETDRIEQPEADVRANYIDWLFYYLGWDAWKEDPHPSNRYHREGYHRGAGFVDVGLEVAGELCLILEAKRFGLIPHSQDRQGDRTPEERQLFAYARRRGIPYGILTNFERLQIFNTDHEVLILSFDKPSEYLDRLDELQRLSPDKVKAGSLQDWERKREIKPIDKQFLTSLQDWRLRLANAIYEHNLTNPALQSDGTFDFGKLMEAVQRILDRLILIRYADDKEVLQQYDILHTIVSSYHNLGAYSTRDHLMRGFIELSHSMDKEHNTTLFKPGHLCEQVFIPNEVLASTIKEMNNISFRKFTSDILGNTYETYLGTKLALRNGEIKSEERRDIRKAGGIFYTPTMVVHYIVDNTLGRQLKELESQHGLHAIEKAQEIRVLDPACGSGSFLIYAYQVLADFYRRMNEAIENERVKLLASVSSTDMFQRLELFKQLPQPSIDYPRHILEKQLYGVDIDPEAAEIAAVNLTMQAFADTRREKLPLILNENIKVGNSLISGTEEELRRYFGDDWQDKKRFNWEEEFKDIMANGGFDVVIANPPWVSNDNIEETEKNFFRRKYQVAKNRFDLANIFVEKSLNVLKKDGHLFFVMPEHVWLGEYFVPFREYLSKHTRIIEILSSKEGSFKQVSNPSSIFLVKNTTSASTEQDMTLGTFLHGDQPYRFQAKTDILRRVIFDEFTHRLVKRIESLRLPELEQIALVTDGIQTADLLKLIFTQQPSDKGKYFRALRSGKAIRFRYSPIEWDEWWVLKPEYTKTLRRPGFSYDSPKRMSCFSAKEKIILRQTEPTIFATLDCEGFLFPNSIFQIALPKHNSESLRFILGVLNSTFLRFYYAKLAQVEGTTKPQIYLNILKSLPIPNSPETNISSLTNEILNTTKDQDYLSNPIKQAKVKELEREIDQKVYELYGLTEKESQVIEASL